MNATELNPETPETIKSVAREVYFQIESDLLHIRDLSAMLAEMFDSPAKRWEGKALIGAQITLNTIHDHAAAIIDQLTSDDEDDEQEPSAFDPEPA